MLRFNTVPSSDLSSQEIRNTKLTGNRLQKHKKAHVLLAVMLLLTNQSTCMRTGPLKGHVSQFCDRTHGDTGNDVNPVRPTHEGD